MTILHSSFLVHWVGKEFHKPPDAPLNDKLRNKYVETLIHILENGLEMRRGKEEIYDLNGNLLETFISRVCFTEIKLSQARRHAERYGSVGIGVSREFILQNYGNPVFYMESGKSNVAVNANRVLEFLKNNDRAGDTLLEYRTLLAYFKNMNDDGKDDLKYYDELEWRITHLNRLENEGRITALDRDNHLYMFRLNRDDIKILVFPDEQTKTMTFEDSRFPQLVNKPICLTIKDCENF